MRVAPQVALLLVPAVAVASPAGSQTVEPAAGTSAVVGGTDAPPGKWPDAAAMLFGGQAQCTGTLIAPTVAITAGHCNDASLTSILLDTNSLNRTSEGEVLQVMRRQELVENDITVVILANASRVTPRPIATGWAQFDIKNGASVAIVGYGATDNNASQFTDALQEATSTITDFDCSTTSGCSTFELAAGGNGIDSCNGDSGGPLYLLTDYGELLVGVTSRAFDNATQPCGQGGIYGRPDQVIDAIEQAAGVKVTHGPEPTAEQIAVIRGDAGETTIDPADPKSDDHSFEIVTPPTMGTAAVSSKGTLRVCINSDAAVGNAVDSVGVKVTDKTNTNRSVTTKIAISVGTNEPSSGDCDVNAFGDDGDGGCCDAGQRSTGAIPLALGIGLVLRRRRRR